MDSFRTRVRSEGGEEILDLLKDEVRQEAPQTAGKRKGPVRDLMQKTRRAAGCLRLREMPDWLRRIVGWLMPRIGHQGLEFARTRVGIKVKETMIHLRREQLTTMRAMVAHHLWQLVKSYGLSRQAGEQAQANKVGSDKLHLEANHK